MCWIPRTWWYPRSVGELWNGWITYACDEAHCIHGVARGGVVMAPCFLNWGAVETFSVNDEHPTTTYFFGILHFITFLLREA